MDTQIREQTEAEKLLAHHPSTKALNIPMTATPVKGADDKRYSSQIAAHGYDLERKTMRIEFRHGASLYDYHHVSPEKAAALLACDSFGRWVEANLKGVHHYERVREPSYYKGT